MTRPCFSTVDRKDVQGHTLPLKGGLHHSKRAASTIFQKGGFCC